MSFLNNNCQYVDLLCTAKQKLDTSNYDLLSSGCESVNESVSVHVLPQDSVIEPLVYVTRGSGYWVGHGVVPICHIHHIHLKSSTVLSWPSLLGGRRRFLDRRKYILISLETYLGCTIAQASMTSMSYNWTRSTKPDLLTSPMFLNGTRKPSGALTAGNPNTSTKINKINHQT